MIVDQKVVKGNFDGWWSKPETLVGTGAFKMSARAGNESLEFTAIPSWWGRPKPTLGGRRRGLEEADRIVRCRNGRERAEAIEVEAQPGIDLPEFLPPLIVNDGRGNGARAE